ncbi:MAG: methyltransferase domain-containing protein [Anaerolineales bacterium]
MTLKPVLNFDRERIIQEYNHRYERVGDLRETDAFYRWVLERLNPKPGSRVLDIACGEGHLLKWVTRAKRIAVGLDLSTRAITVARRFASLERGLVGDGQTLPIADESFEYITNIGSLEHFADLMQGLQEMRRVLRPAGRIAVLVPNSYYLLDIIWHVWRTGYAVSHRQTIERFATFREWWDLLEDGGLHVLEAHKYNFAFPRSRADMNWYRQHPRKLLYLAASPFIPRNLSYSFLYICRRD